MTRIESTNDPEGIALRQEAQAIADDPEDRAEARAVLADMESLRVG